MVVSIINTDDSINILLCKEKHNLCKNTAEVQDIFAEILKMFVMKKLENELRLINLKEWITNHPEVVNKLVQIVGTNQGWKELCVELKSPYNIVRRLKDMPICELNYSKRDFTMMRHEM